MDDNTIANWTEIELIQNVFFELRRSSAAASGLAEYLATGPLGFSNDEQREVIDLVLKESNILEEVTRWMKVWVLNRNNIK